MPILRAGPWGDLADNHQSEPPPPAEGEPYIVYPVNVGGRESAHGSAWQTTYETEVAERICTSPCSIDVTFPYTDDFGATIKYQSVTIPIGSGSGPCSYLYIIANATYYDPAQYVFSLNHNGGNWEVLYGNFYFAYTDNTTILQSASNPITDFTITDSLYYNGYNITITDPNV